MRRHARQVHQTEAKRLCDIRAERTCKACRIAKSSCEGRNPCRRCFHEGLDCSLSSDRISRRSPGTDNTIKVNSSIHRYTQRYFQHCHPQWPILHPSTFSIRDEPSLLLYSVVAIGLWTDNTPSSRSMASALHAKLGDSIRQQKVGPRTPSYSTLHADTGGCDHRVSGMAQLCTIIKMATLLPHGLLRHTKASCYTSSLLYEGPVKGCSTGPIMIFSLPWLKPVVDTIFSSTLEWPRGTRASIRLRASGSVWKRLNGLGSLYTEYANYAATATAAMLMMNADLLNMTS